MNAHRNPTFSAGLQWGLHALVAVLATIALLQVPGLPAGRGVVGVAAIAAFALLYALGAVDAVRGTRGAVPPPRPPASGTGKALPRPTAVAGTLALTLVWAVAAWAIPEAAYLVFPLFFVQLHLLGRTGGPLAFLASTAVSIAVLGWHQGFSVAGFVGPLLGAAVALLIGAATRAFARQAAAREQLLAELLSTRDELAQAQHQAGVEAERSRLARDIHDTISQSLSSVQMFLHAAERAEGGEDRLRLIRLGRESAEGAQAEARSIVRALTPAPLAGQTLPGALRRLAAGEWAGGPAVVVTGDADVDLEMGTQAALLRLAQGAVGNALQHARATRVVVDLSVAGGEARLSVVDDGGGFDPTAVPGAQTGPGHFGLASMRQRTEQLGGTLSVLSREGSGTTVTVAVPLRPPAPASEPALEPQPAPKPAQKDGANPHDHHPGR